MSLLYGQTRLQVAQPSWSASNNQRPAPITLRNPWEIHLGGLFQIGHDRSTRHWTILLDVDQSTEGPQPHGLPTAETCHRLLSKHGHGTERFVGWPTRTRRLGPFASWDNRRTVRNIERYECRRGRYGPNSRCTLAASQHRLPQVAFRLGSLGRASDVTEPKSQVAPRP